MRTNNGDAVTRGPLGTNGEGNKRRVVSSDKVLLAPGNFACPGDTLRELCEAVGNETLLEVVDGMVGCWGGVEESNEVVGVLHGGQKMLLFLPQRQVHRIWERKEEEVRED